MKTGEVKEMASVDWSLKLDIERLVRDGAVIVCVVPKWIRDDGGVRDYLIVYQCK